MVLKPIIKLDRTEIEKAIRMGDNCNGSRVLAVAPDGNEWAIHWLENNRQWDNWPSGWLTIGIPALNPEGEAEENERAEECLQHNMGHEKVQATIDALCELDVGLVEFVEKFCPESWAAWNQEATDWLMDAFLSACNGRGDDLGRGDMPWGCEESIYGEVEVIAPPAEFEWAEDAAEEEALCLRDEIVSLCKGMREDLKRIARE